MVRPLHNAMKVLLMMFCLSMPAVMMAEDMQESQVEMEQTQVSISVNGTTLRVKNADGMVLEIFSLTGNKVYTQRVEGQSRAYELAHLQRGYYIVKIGNFTRKVYLQH